MKKTDFPLRESVFYFEYHPLIQALVLQHVLIVHFSLQNGTDMFRKGLGSFFSDIHHDEPSSSGYGDFPLLILSHIVDVKRRSADVIHFYKKLQYFIEVHFP